MGAGNINSGLIVPQKQAIVPASSLQELSEDQLMSALAEGLGIQPADFELFRANIGLAIKDVNNANQCQSDEELTAFMELLRERATGKKSN